MTARLSAAAAAPSPGPLTRPPTAWPPAAWPRSRAWMRRHPQVPDAALAAALVAVALPPVSDIVGPNRWLAAVVAPAVTRRLLDAFLPHLPGPVAPAAEPPELSQLTAREREILIQVAAGQSNAEIAQQLFLAEATVKTHVSRVLTKLSLRDRVQAVVYAYENGLVRPGALP